MFRIRTMLTLPIFMALTALPACNATTPTGFNDAPLQESSLASLQTVLDLMSSPACQLIHSRPAGLDDGDDYQASKPAIRVLTELLRTDLELAPYRLEVERTRLGERNGQVYYLQPMATRATNGVSTDLAFAILQLSKPLGTARVELYACRTISSINDSLPRTPRPSPAVEVK